MELVTIKMERELLEDIESAMKQNNYSTRTEFIRDALRDKLRVIHKEEAIKRLSLLKGILKGKTRHIDEEVAGELAFKEIAKKQGLKLD